jgi:hypothetical protein
VEAEESQSNKTTISPSLKVGQLSSLTSTQLTKLLNEKRKKKDCKKIKSSEDFKDSM